MKTRCRSDWETRLMRNKKMPSKDDRPWLRDAVQGWGRGTRGSNRQKGPNDKEHLTNRSRKKQGRDSAKGGRGECNPSRCDKRDSYGTPGLEEHEKFAERLESGDQDKEKNQCGKGHKPRKYNKQKNGRPDANSTDVPREERKKHRGQVLSPLPCGIWSS